LNRPETNTTLESDSVLASLIDISKSADSDELAQALEDSKELEAAYAGVARKGDTEAPANAEDEVDYHYIAFVKSSQSNHLYQLNGVHHQPMALGVLAPEEDVLSDKCFNVIRGMMASDDNNLGFSLMALVEE
jgi:ubiquitin carboxyl-terminal hydrolase L3